MIQKNVNYYILVGLVGWLDFYGISTVVVYLTPNSFLYK